MLYEKEHDKNIWTKCSKNRYDSDANSSRRKEVFHEIFSFLHAKLVYNYWEKVRGTFGSLNNSIRSWPEGLMLIGEP